MSAYFDTSAIIKLYFPEAESEALSKWVSEQKQIIPLSLFHKTEICNAFALKLFRGEISEEQYHQILLCIDEDQQAGILKELSPDWMTVFRKSADIARQHTPSMGTRSLDIIHVALAVASRCKHFLTFDKRQSELASACGLEQLVFEKR